MCTNNTNDSSISTVGKVSFNTHFTDSFALNEAFKALRSNLLFCGSDIKTVVVTSSIEGEGKSTISTELANSIAQINKKTLLIYGDMRKPGRMNKNRKVAGLSELLSGELDISQVIFSTQNPHLNVIFNGRLPDNPAELLTSDTFAKILEKLKTEYEYIIIDSPPLIPVIDAALISTLCDGAVLVIASERTTINEINMAKEQLEKSDCKILGAVLNQTQESVQTKHYGKKYSYYTGSYANK